ncbi:MAG: outer membrane lipoprotein carrier protein [Pseudoalteromonas tetraodonis]
MNRFVFSVLVLFAPLASSASEENLRKFFNEVSTLQADFEQQVVDETGMTLEVSKGIFSLSRPGRFRWNYASSDPDLSLGQQIVADGSSIFMYDPDLEQVTQRSLQDALNQVPSMLLVQSGVNLEEHFSIVDFGLTDGLTWVALKPKDENAGYQQLLIGFAKGEMRSITLLDGLGNETRLNLSNIQNNIKLSDDVFTFVAPPDADILSE